MKLSKTYKIRFGPGPALMVIFTGIAIHCRLVCNLCFERRRDHWRCNNAVTGRSIGWCSQKNRLPDLKKVFAVLAEVPPRCLYMALKDHDTAYQKLFFGRAEYQTPRRRGVDDSFRFPVSGQFHLGHKWLVVRKSGRRSADRGPLWIVARRKAKGRIKTISIIGNGAHWFACLSAARVVP